MASGGPHVKIWNYMNWGDDMNWVNGRWGNDYYNYAIRDIYIVHDAN